jgi:hypothetical protein
MLPFPPGRQRQPGLLARDLKLIEPKEYAGLAQHTIEVKRMLTALIQKLKADR